MKELLIGLTLLATVSASAQRQSCMAICGRHGPNSLAQSFIFSEKYTCRILKDNSEVIKAKGWFTSQKLQPTQREWDRDHKRLLKAIFHVNTRTLVYLQDEKKCVASVFCQRTGSTTKKCMDVTQATTIKELSSL